MSAGKEIRGKIRSIRNTQKITRAMEMVAASKMRKAQDRMAASRPFSDRIYSVINHLARSHSEYRHPYLQEREEKRVGIIIVSTDRGLCGGLNANLFKSVLNTLREYKERKIPVDLCIIGKKAESFFNRFGHEILGSVSHLGDKPTIEQLLGVVRVMLDAFDDGKLDRLFVFYNQFINTMTLKPINKQLLPLPTAEDDSKSLSHHWDYIYEPDAKELLDKLLTRYIESQVYQAVIENVACEQAARMVAMKSASDNAGDLINQFQLAYNKARQAAITQEIAEIVGGAEAL